MQPNPWILNKPNASASQRIFCFPYAGGSASIYSPWSKQVPETVDICPIQLPGRETRLHEPPINDLSELLLKLEVDLQPLFDKPFAFFGHSMGAIIAFELAHRLSTAASPIALFLSACPPPNTVRRSPLHSLPDDEFVMAIQKRYQMMPPRVVQDSTLLQLFLPILRADFTLYETYSSQVNHQLSCPIHVFGGLQDLLVRYTDLAAWQQKTDNDFTLRMFPGNHFFLKNAQVPLLKAISKKIL